MGSFDAIGEAFVRLRPKQDGSFEDDARQQILPGLQRIAGDAALLFAGKKLLDIGVAGLDELKQSEQVTAQTTLELKNLGGQTNVTGEQVDALGQKMLDLAGFDDEAGRSAANVLLRFKSITDSGTLTRVETDAADLATTMGTDLPSAARTLGLALEDPLKAIRLLRSANVVLDDSQKEALKSAAAQGDQAKVNDIILGSLERSIGGAAKAYGDTLAGAEAKATENLKNAKAELVQGFAPALQIGANAVSALAKGVTSLPPALQAVGGGLFFVGGEAAALLRPAADLLRVIDSLRAARAASTAATLAATSAEEAAVAVEKARAIASAAAAVASESLWIEDSKRIVSGEQLTFSETEIAAALQAREVAQAQMVVSNGALIAAEERLAVAEAEAAAAAAAESVAQTEVSISAGASALALAGSLGAFGALAIGVGAVAVGIGALTGILGEDTNQITDSKSATTGYTQALKDNTSAAIDNATAQQLAGAGATDGAKEVAHAYLAANIPLQAFYDQVRRGTSELDNFGTHLSHNANLFDTTWLSSITRAAEGGNTFAQGLLSAYNAGKLTADQVVQIIKTANNLSGSLGDATAASDLFSGVVSSTGDSVDTATGSIKNQEQALKDAKDAAKSLQDTYQSLIDNTLDSFGAALDQADAAIATRKALQDLANLPADEADKATSLAKAVADAEKAVGNAQERLRGAKTDAEKKSATDALATANDQLAAAQKRQADGALSAADAADTLQSKQDAALKAINAQAKAAVTNADAVSKATTGAGISAAAQNQILIQSYTDIESTLAPDSPLRSVIDGYIQQLQGVPRDVPTAFHADTAAAQKALDDYVDSLGAAQEGLTLDQYRAKYNAVGTGRTSTRVRNYAAGGDLIEGGHGSVGETEMEAWDWPVGGKPRITPSGTGQRVPRGSVENHYHNWHVVAPTPTAAATMVVERLRRRSQVRAR